MFTANLEEVWGTLGRGWDDRMNAGGSIYLHERRCIISKIGERGFITSVWVPYFSTHIPGSAYIVCACLASGLGSSEIAFDRARSEAVRGIRFR